MTARLQGAITSDIDTLASIYKGTGCRRSNGYTGVEFHMGLENFQRFLEPYNVRATLFMVGNDLRHEENHAAARAMVAAGHEIANHTMTHAQGFRSLTVEEKERELADMEAICEEVTGRCPVGFRSPGRNVSDDALPILKRRGYLYDSSVFPTSLMPLLKLMHWRTMRSRRGGDRTTLGHWRYMAAAPVPYRTSLRSLAERGSDGIWEIPVTVTPVVRLPLFATFLVSTGLALFRASVRALQLWQRPVQFQFHLSDFVDYAHPDLADQVPTPGDGVYVPAALRMPLERKLSLFREAMDLLAEHWEFTPLAEWAYGLAPVGVRRS